MRTVANRSNKLSYQLHEAEEDKEPEEGRRSGQGAEKKRRDGKRGERRREKQGKM